MLDFKYLRYLDYASKPQIRTALEVQMLRWMEDILYHLGSPQNVVFPSAYEMMPGLFHPQEVLQGKALEVP